MKINDRIKLRREELDISQREVGQYVGVTGVTIQRYESGEIKNLKQVTIEKLAKILKVTPSYLVGWEERIYNPFENISTNFKDEIFTKNEQKEIIDYIKFVLTKRL